MTLDELEHAIGRFPRRRIGFYPTPLHKAENISRRYGVDIYFKREDMAGPGTISGSKVRPAEFIIGEALEQGVTHLLTVGAYLSNSATQLASAAIQAGITPIVFLYDNLGEGHPAAWRGNLLLNKVMGIEVHCFPRKPDESQEKVWDQTLYPAVEVRKAELEAEGNKVLVAAAGAIHPSGLAAHLLTYKEISEQSHALGFTPDYLYHTTGTGGVLPAFVAGRLLTGGSPRTRSIAISSYRPDNYIHHGIIVERVKAIHSSLGQVPPTEDAIMAEIDIDSASSVRTMRFHPRRVPRRSGNSPQATPSSLDLSIPPKALQDCSPTSAKERSRSEARSSSSTRVTPATCSRTRASPGRSQDKAAWKEAHQGSH